MTALATRYSDEEDTDIVAHEEEHRLWPNARLGLLHLVKMLETDDYRFEPTPELMKACGIQSYSHWKKVHQLMRDWLADRGYDLVNHFSRDGGYAIGRYPVQTFRELLKSTFRALGHLGSANVRNEKLSSWLGKLTGDSSVQFMRFRTAMGFLMTTSEQMKKNIREIEQELPAMAGVADEVTNIPNKLLAMPDADRAKFLRPEEAFDQDVATLRKAIEATRAR